MKMYVMVTAYILALIAFFALVPASSYCFALDYKVAVASWEEDALRSEVERFDRAAGRYRPAKAAEVKGSDVGASFMRPVDKYIRMVVKLTAWELYQSDPKLVKHKRMTKQDILQLIEDVSKAEDINPVIIKAMVQAESSFRIHVVSSKGAYGLMQLMPRTAEELGVDPTNPVENLIGGIRYFKQMRNKFMGYTTLALAAYNAGPKRIIGLKIPKIRETRRYVKLVYKLYYRYKREALT